VTAPLSTAGAPVIIVRLSRSAIRHHNHLNGVVFSTLEFLFLLAVAAFFAGAYALRQNWLFAIAARESRSMPCGSSALASHHGGAAKWAPA
jgi:hypothetical protein